ncbi:hypothetical protein McaMca56_002592 [Microsporum canis]
MATPLTIPRALHFFLSACFLLPASRTYKPDHAALAPAESFLKPAKFIYDVRSSTGGKSIGNGWKGRKWSAVTKVASNVGGKGDSICDLVDQFLSELHTSERRLGTKYLPMHEHTAPVTALALQMLKFQAL